MRLFADARRFRREAPAATGRAAPALGPSAPEAPAALPFAWSRLRPALAGAGLVGLWLLVRPYGGLLGDAAVYMGRAVADLDPNGIGRELEFLRDGQSSFSIFPALARALVAWVGAGPAAELIALAGLLAWLASAAFLLSRRLSGARLLAALLAVTVLPAGYGYIHVFSFAEAMATARPLAEAAALTGLGLFLDRRWIAAAAVLALGLALHPLMAAPVVAIAGLLLAMEDRRWLWAAAAGAAVALAAAALGAPVAGRLFETFDPAWREIVRIRTAPVFVQTWPEASWALLVCQLATAILAGALLPDLRRLAFAAAGVALLGIAVATAPSVLLVQLQTWRAGWPLAVLAAALLPIVAGALWRRGPAGRSALALLAIAWLARDSLMLAGVSAALALWLGLKPPGRPVPRLVWVGLFAAAGALAVAVEGLRITATLARNGADLRSPLVRTLDIGLHAVVLAGLASVLAVRPLRLESRLAMTASAAAAGLLLVGAVLLWDDRSDFARWTEAPAGPAPVRAAFAPGQVFWTAGYGASWLATGRPEWWSPLQGAGVVFDRPMAMEWARRREIARAAGLAPKAGRTARLSSGALDLLCRAPGGPDQVTAPVQALEPALAAKASATFDTPPLVLLDADGSRRTEAWRFAVFSCRRG